MSASYTENKLAAGCNTTKESVSDEDDDVLQLLTC